MTVDCLSSPSASCWFGHRIKCLCLHYPCLALLKLLFLSPLFLYVNLHSDYIELGQLLSAHHQSIGPRQRLDSRMRMSVCASHCHTDNGRWNGFACLMSLSNVLCNANTANPHILTSLCQCLGVRCCRQRRCRCQQCNCRTVSRTAAIKESVCCCSYCLPRLPRLQQLVEVEEHLWTHWLFSAAIHCACAYDVGVLRSWLAIISKPKGAVRGSDPLRWRE